MEKILTPEFAATSAMPKTIRTVHWLSAMTIVLTLGLVLLRKLVDEDDAISATILGFHRQLGLLVLLLWAARLIARWSLRHQIPREALPLLLRLAATGAHLALYAVLMSLPLLGWAMTNARGRVVSLFNTVPLPILVATDPDLADTLQDWHAWGAWTLAALVAAHVGAALWHHWVRRDGVLVSMLPRLQRRPQRQNNF